MKSTVIGLLAAAAAMLFAFSPVFAANDASGSFNYPIKHGTNLTRIAKDFGVSKQALIEANKSNPGFKSPDKILAGGKLNIPNVYTAKDVLQIRASDAHKANETTQTIVRTVEKEFKAKRSNSMALLGISSLVLLVLMLNYIFKYCAERDLLSEVRLGLAKAENELANLRMSNEEKDRIIESLQINLKVGREQVSALTQAKNEAENLRNERVSLLNELEKARADLKERVAVGDKITLSSQENGDIEFTVNRIEVFVNCPSNSCIVNGTKTLKVHNALSHYFNGHSNSLPAGKPKEESSSDKVGVNHTEEIPA